ncbi:MAG: 50S ribosomal protein L10 [Alphaproteobacteria bacterium]|nr:50S ribosomal protein L10 [Alphaproteobacteria bacterium]MCB1551366.1 50S ribosomal protein L10 [Alphaproteobacteria bacterium]MCB9985671.1 50S ribosomal protein L10 [Micavibrio sp.]HPQ51108.1 50S ribosomal protein L10 [Alphaproteobacteria bacterium]HRK97700.1 50S ribosomal protein L10 [Alphaproteobacteria bacterium]
MNRAEKQTEIDALKSTLGSTEIVIVSHNTGMSVAQVTELRQGLRAQGARYKVTKNTLTKIAIKGTKHEEINDMLTGPTGLSTTTEEPLVVAKTIYDFAKKFNGKLVIVGGYFGEMKLDPAAIETLAKLPTLDQIRGQLVGLIQAPAAQLARLANAYSEKQA